MLEPVHLKTKVSLSGPKSHSGLETPSSLKISEQGCRSGVEHSPPTYVGRIRFLDPPWIEFVGLS